LGASAVKRIVAAACLCLAGAAVSALLLLQHHGEPLAASAVADVCGSGPASGCEEVARSSWSTFAGRPLAAYGTAYYLALAIALALALLGPAELREPLAGLVVAGLALGLLVDLGLLGVQAFAIKAYCRLCLASYVLAVLAFVALLPAWRAVRLLPTAFGRPDGRLALSAWALAALVVAAAVWAGDVALVQRAALRQARLLGAPVAAPAAVTPAAAPATSAPALEATAAAGTHDARYWQERAQQLQDTIDDPRKLETYFSQKAQRDYDAAPPVSIDLGDAVGRGPATAPVKVVEYSDFLCPYCRNLALALTQFLPQAGGRLAIYFKNFPLDASCNTRLPQSTHPGACNVALGAVCAQRQGKFEAYHDKVFSSELKNPQPADVVRLAGEAGLNALALQDCLDDPQTKATLAAQIAEANGLKVSSTPTVYINGKKLAQLNYFLAIVDKEARKKGFPALAGQ